MAWQLHGYRASNSNVHLLMNTCVHCIALRDKPHQQMWRHRELTHDGRQDILGREPNERAMNYEQVVQQLCLLDRVIVDISLSEPKC